MKDILMVGLLIAVGLVVVVGIGWAWMWYQWCDYGQSLYVTRKTGTPSPPGRYAQTDQKGVQEQMRGPGRHFINPWTYSITRVKDVYIPPEFIATVKSNVGDPLPEGGTLAESHQKGMQRAVLTPGLWRINKFGQVIAQQQAATVIQPGYVGVQTLRVGPNKGIQPEILQAGYYNINPLKIRVDEVEIGYRVWDSAVRYTGQGRDLKLVEGTGVSFPLADGKQMHLDMTVVWGIFPKDAPRIIDEYGTVADVEDKIIRPRVESICKNAGSNLTTQEFIEGETREEFATKVTEELKNVGEKKGIHFLIALVRGFHPAADIKATIQATLIAEEEKTTLKFEQERDTIAAQLEKAVRRVEAAARDFNAETEALVQEEMELGRKKAAEIEAEANRLVAQFQKQSAEIDAQSVKIAGQATADVIEAKKKAEATRLQLLIEAYGGPDQYNLATFAESLPDGIKIEYRYAGEGTFWTDAKTTLSDMADKKILQRKKE